MEKESRNSLLQTNVNIEPTGIMYKVFGRAIEDFVKKLLIEQGVTAVADVRVAVVRDGTQPNIRVFVFLEANAVSSANRQQMAGIPEALRVKATPPPVSLSPEATAALAPLCRNKVYASNTGRGKIAVQVDEFAVLALMFAAKAGVHRIIIPEVNKVNNRECVISIVKQPITDTRNNGDSGDVYSSMVNSLINDRDDNRGNGRRF